jgi:hypothetical protein
MKVILREDVYNLGNSGSVVAHEGRLRPQLPAAGRADGLGGQRAQLEHEKAVIAAPQPR